MLIYFAVVIILLNLGHLLPRREDLIAVGVASAAAGSWCAVNFWRCRHAHCLVTSFGWLGLSCFSFTEAILGHSVIGDEEGVVFVVVLAAGLLFEVGWRVTHSSNAVTRTTK